MSSSNPLGEKYARYKALNPSTRRARSRSPIRVLAPPRSAPRSLSTKYDDFLKTGPTVSRRTNFEPAQLREKDSPIKILRGSAVTRGVPSLYRRNSPNRTYKRPETHGISKTRKWLENKDASSRESLLKKESVFLKLRLYLTLLSSTDDNEYKQLSESAGLTRPEKVSETPGRVSFDPSLFQRRYTSWDKINERDEVDEEVKKAKAREEVKSLQDRIHELEQLLTQERAQWLDTRESLERELYLAKQDHEAVVHTLRQEVKGLEFRASRRFKDLEREKLADLRTEVLRENESFLKQQNIREQNLRKREEQLEERALALDKQRIGLEKREIDVKLREEFLAKAEARLKARQEEDREGSIRERIQDAEAKIRKNEEDQKRFRDIVDAVAEDTRNMRDHNLRLRLTNLITPPDEGKKANSLDKWEALFKDYDEYFQTFESLKSDLRGTGMYDMASLEQIEQNFKQLQIELKDKIQKRDFRISQLDTLIRKSWVKRYDFDIVKAERIAQYLKNRDALCEKQRTNYKILQTLSDFESKLKSLQSATH